MLNTSTASSMRSTPRHLRTCLLRNTPTRPSSPSSILQSLNGWRAQQSRKASTAQAAAETAGRTASTLRRTFFVTTAILGSIAGYYYITDTRASIHSWLIVPLLRATVSDAEDAHELGTHALRTLYSFNLHPRERESGPGPDLAVEIFGHRLSNPIGISAGLDKHADIPSALFALGPGLVEVGGTTPVAQEGNPKPRVFRIPSQNALINRYGLNSAGAEHVAGQLRQRVREFAATHGLGADERAERFVLDGGLGVPPGSLVAGGLLAVQIAKNKETPESDIDAVRRDYEFCASKLARYADVIVLNVSSPNTPGLRSLQAAEPLQKLLQGVVATVQKTDRRTKPAVMVKVSPDEDSDEEVKGICSAVLASGIDGIIVGNTTKKRPAPVPAGYKLEEKEARTIMEMGGYSGPQMFERTLALIKKYKNNLDKAELSDAGKGRKEPPVIFATGGITNGAQALEVLNAGASVAQIYTAMVYGGSGTITRIKQEMKDEILKKKSA